MNSANTVNPVLLFYKEPDPDRWFVGDHHPRRIIRRFLRGPARPGGHTRVFLNLCAGLKRLGVSFQVNNYQYAHNHPEQLVCIIGKPQLLDEVPWQNPILFGAAVFSHPLDDPRLFERLPVKRMLVPGEWMRRMCEPYFGDRVVAWPVGIDTEAWKVRSGDTKEVDFLLYDKIRWEHERYESELLRPIRASLDARGLSSTTLRYGFYKEAQLRTLLDRCRAMIFLCEHETQGIAYQQSLACGVPILAWDRGDFWRDPQYYPVRVRFGPVSSVPYWDERCGVKFRDVGEFDAALDHFLIRLGSGDFKPRDYILENLTLEGCAANYLKFWRDVQSQG